MTATVRLYHAVTYEVDGRIVTFGSLSDPVAEFSAPGTAHRSKIVNVPADGIVTVWSWDEMPEFELVALRIRGSGYLHVAALVDTPVSESDQSASGNNERWRAWDMSCKVPFILSSDGARVNPTPADDYGDDAGDPALFTSVATEDGRVYALSVQNRGDDPVELEVLVLN